MNPDALPPAGASTAGGGTPKFVTQLNVNDVLVGRGAPSIDNEGNIRFRRVISNRKQEYMHTNKRQIKDGIARQVMDTIESKQGRFLRKIESLVEAEELGVPTGVTAYALVDEEAILLKVKQALRGRDRAGAAGGAARGDGSPMGRTTVGDFHPGVMGAGGPFGAGPMAALLRAGMYDAMGAGGNLDLLRLNAMQQQQQNSLHQAAMFNDPYLMGGGGMGMSGLGGTGAAGLDAFQQQQQQQQQQLMALMEAQQLQQPSARLGGLGGYGGNDFGGLGGMNPGSGMSGPSSAAAGLFPQGGPSRQKDLISQALAQSLSSQRTAASQLGAAGGFDPSGFGSQQDMSSPMLGGMHGASTPLMEQLLREEQRRTMLGSSGMGQAHQQQQQLRGNTDLRQAGADNLTDTAPNDDTLGDRLLRQALERQASREPSEQLVGFSLLEYLTLKVLCSRGMPVASATTMSPFLYTWADVGTSIRQTAASLQNPQQQPDQDSGWLRDRVGRLVLMYTTDVPGLAVKTVQLLKRLANRTVAASPLVTSLVQTWFGNELNKWSSTLPHDSAASQGGASAPGMDSSAGRRSGEPSEERLSPSHSSSTLSSTIASLDGPACQSILLQIACLTRLRSLLLENTNARALLRECVVESNSNVPRWDRRPAFWESVPNDMMRNDVQLLERVTLESYASVQPAWFEGIPNGWGGSLREANLDKELLQGRCQDLVLFMHRWMPAQLSNQPDPMPTDFLLNSNTTASTGRNTAPSLSNMEVASIMKHTVAAAAAESSGAQLPGEDIVPKGPKRKRPKHEQSSKADSKPSARS